MSLTPFDDWVRDQMRDRAAAPARTPGVYWVKDGSEPWRIAEYIDREWFPCGWDSGFHDLGSIVAIGPLSPPADG
jgi:hypothetical protein